MSDTMKDFVKKKMVLIEANTSTLEAYNLMKKNNIRHIPIVNNGQAIGIISDRDLQFVSHTGDDLNLTVEDIMTQNPLTVDSDTTIPHVIQLMNNKKVNSVLIHGKDKKIEGIFTSTDALSILYKTYKTD